MKRDGQINVVGEVASPKVVSFAGVGRGDILYYLSRYLDADGNKVLFVDNSESKDVYNAIKKADNETIGYQKNVTFVKNLKLPNQDVLADFDFVIVNHGTKFDEEWVCESGRCFVMSNYETESMNIAKDLVNCFQEQGKEFSFRLDWNIDFIFRDKAIKSQKDIRFLKEMGIDKVPFSEIFVLNYDAKDYSSYLEFLYAGRQSIRSADLSNEMMDLLHYMVETLTQKDKKSMKKLNRRVSKKMKGGLI